MDDCRGQTPLLHPSSQNFHFLFDSPQLIYIIVDEGEVCPSREQL